MKPPTDSNSSGRDLSLVIPVYNEVDNLRPLWQEIHEALDGRGINYEVIFVDDGSNDGSFALLSEIAEEDPRVIAIRFRRNFGQTAAFAAGFDHATGDAIVTMDADRQNDPGDIPALLEKLDEGYDTVSGWRKERQDPFLFRRLPSRVANLLITHFSGVPLRDPEMVSSAGYSMAEVPVSHRPRLSGRSKYGLSRTFRVILDLITVLFLRNYADRPMHLLGGIGIISGGLGVLISGYLALLKIGAGITGGMAAFHATRIGNRPLLMLGILLIFVGIQFLVMGLLAELVVRTYYESQGKPVYYIREIAGQGVRQRPRRGLRPPLFSREASP